MTKNCHNDYKMKFSDEEEFPDLSLHNNHMAKVLTKEMYKKLRSKSTPSGFTLDDCTQTGVDNPGKTWKHTHRKTRQVPVRSQDMHVLICSDWWLIRAPESKTFLVLLINTLLA